MCKEPYAKTLNSKVFPGMQGGPLMHIIAAKAVAFQEALGDGFKHYQHQIVTNAKVLADTLISEGFRLVSGGTDNHLMLLDLSDKGITGKDAQEKLDFAGITVNKNGIPFDTRGPQVTSGIRIGTPAITSRGMKAAEMKVIGGLIAGVLKNMNNEKKIAEVKGEVALLCEKYPLYRERLQAGS